MRGVECLTASFPQSAARSASFSTVLFALLLLPLGATQAREQLGLQQMLDGPYRQRVDLGAYSPGSDAVAPLLQIEGRISLSGQPRTRVVRALADFVDRADVASARSFPTVEFDLVQDGSTLLPAQRGLISTDHGWWDLVVEPGRIWSEPGDQGFSRAAIPFSLVQKNANCTHNGMLMLLFRDGQVHSRAAMQISSETCYYLQLDLWGWLEAGYTARSISSREQIVADQRAAQSSRVPTRPLAHIEADYPGVDSEELAIGDASARSRNGVVFNDVHYVSSCPTRQGNYPACAELDLPSFSLAKSVVAALALMRIEQRFPGSSTRLASELIPATGCRRESWQSVRLIDLLDMASGHFDSTAYMADEDAAKVAPFFATPEHRYKLAFACEAYPYQQAAGERWVYHTSDTYLLGVALQQLLREETGNRDADIFRDVVVAEIFKPLGLSETAMVSRRSDDSTAQPFFGWGLTLRADDVAKLGRFLASRQPDSTTAARLDRSLLQAALQRDPERRGLPVAHLKTFRYQHGFWARDLQSELGCDQPTWVPFMSGFGGLTLALLPNGAVWYNFADDGELASIDFAVPASALAALGDICGAAVAVGNLEAQ